MRGIPILFRRCLHPRKQPAFLASYLAHYKHQILRSGRLRTPHGMFTVRSVYYLEQKKCTKGARESSNAREEEVFWKNLWRLNASALVKNFVWKVGNELLPTKVNLYQRHIVQNPTCPICLQGTKDVFHIFWSCKSSTAVWQECGKKIQKLAVGARDGRSLLHFLITKLDGEDLLLALVVSLPIWLRRNAVVFRREFTAPGRLVEEAHSMVKEFLQATMLTEKTPGLGADSVVIRWVPPPCGSIKINWDAALDPWMKRTGIRVLVCNDVGELIAARSGHVFPIPYGPFHG